MGTKTVLMKFAGLEKNSVCGPIAWPPTRGKTTKGSNRSPWRKKGGNCPPSHLTSVGGNNMPISALLATKEKFVNQKKYKWPHKRNTRPPLPLKNNNPHPLPEVTSLSCGETTLERKEAGRPLRPRERAPGLRGTAAAAACGWFHRTHPLCWRSLWGPSANGGTVGNGRMRRTGRAAICGEAILALSSVTFCMLIHKQKKDEQMESKWGKKRGHNRPPP